MLSYCLKCRKKTEKDKNTKFYGLTMAEQCFYQNMKCVMVKN